MSNHISRRPGEARRLVVVGGGISGLAAARLLAGAAPVSEAGSVSAAGGQARAPRESKAGVPAAGVPAGEAPVSEAGSVSAAGGAEVIVLESAPRLGGKILTGSIAGMPVELGPDQFLRRDPSAERLAELLGLGGDLVAPAVRAAGVYSRGRLRALPTGLVLGVPTDAASLEASGTVSAAGVAAFRRLSGLTDAGPPPATVTPAEAGLDGGEEGGELAAGAILRLLAGDEVVDRLVDPLLGGINAGAVDKLSLATVAPQIARLLAGRSDGLAALASDSRTLSGGERPSPFLGLSGGLSRLVEATRRQLSEELGVLILTGHGVAGIEKGDGGGFTVHLDTGTFMEADGVVLAAPGMAAGRLLERLEPASASRLSAVPYASVALATMAFAPRVLERAAIPPAWSGVLVPRVEGAVTTAVSFLSAKWPWMSEVSGRRSEVIRVSAGRHLDDRIASEDDGALVRRLLKELSQLVGVSAEPSEVHLHRWDRSFPQYLPGHGAAVAEVRRALAGHRGLALAGAVLGGIGIPACISSGERAAEEVLVGLDR